MPNIHNPQALRVALLFDGILKRPSFVKSKKTKRTVTPLINIRPLPLPPVWASEATPQI